jgi:hypothetical protein
VTIILGLIAPSVFRRAQSSYRKQPAVQKQFILDECLFLSIRIADHILYHIAYSARFF